MAKHEMTNLVFLWEDPDGKRRWEAVIEDQMAGFLEKILLEGVNPATVIMGYSPILFHWVWKKYHGGLSDVYFQKINEEIYGREPTQESKHEPVNVPIYKKLEAKYGWVAPDGRFFGCNYGGHSSLAGRIVGEIQYVYDPERYLEDLGWAKVLSGRYAGRQYVIGMGEGKKLADAQLKTLEQMGLGNAYGISSLL